MLVYVLLPALNTPFAYVAGAGVILFALSTFCTKTKTAARMEFISLCTCTTGSVTIMKAIAEAYHR